ncbi:MAG: response regulator [Candidatus Binatia bacterium]
MSGRTISHSGTILIVDDEPSNVEYLKQELQEFGYETVSAAHGHEALAKVAAEAPDLILLDVLMPGMDGFAVCRRLKEQEETQLIPVVIMTALGAREDRITGIEAGADDFLTKPVDPQELLARVQTAVKFKQAIDRKIKGQGPGKKADGSAPSAEAPANSFRQEGEYWTVAYQGTAVRVRDVIGIRYLAYLLRYPHQQIHVLDLEASVEGSAKGISPSSTKTRDATAFADLSVRPGLGDAGEILDSQAKAAYKQRLQELRVELEDAQTCNDPGRATRAQQDIDFLTQEIVSGVGLGGRDRLAASAAERARVNVTRAIKDALRRLSTYHAALGKDLTGTLNTGAYCSYTPDIRLPSPWQVS